MRSTLLFAISFLALLPVACGSAGEGSGASNSSNGTGGATSDSTSTSTSTLAGGGGNSSGTASGGTASGGTASGGTASGGTASGGTASGGTASGGTASGGTAGSGTASSGSTSTGTSSSGSSSSGSSSTGTGGAVCAGYIDVISNRGFSHFITACQGAWGTNESSTALGYHFSGGVFPGFNEIDLLGCADMSATSAGIHLSARNASAPGTFTSGDMSYTDANGGSWYTTGESYQVVITKLENPGGVIEGTFSVKATGPADTTITLTGSFHVCRVSDELAP
jgi:hypothetical protein